MSIIRPPLDAMNDRVDVLRRPQAVAGQLVVGVDETPVAFDVACLILEATASRAQTMMGTAQENAFTAYLGPEPIVRANDVLKHRDSGARYVVRTARKYPSPHDVQVQLLELSLDVATAAAPVP